MRLRVNILSAFKISWAWVTFGVAFSSAAHAQFVDVSNAMDIYTDHTGGLNGSGISLADFNGDGFDDLSIGHHNGDLKFFIGNGVDFEPFELNLPYYDAEAKSILWADLDNDGDQDLLVTYRLAENKLYINQGNLNLIDVSATCGIDQSERRSYGASFGDYDADGFLDLFIANYVGGQDIPFNELYHNNGDGTFEDVTFDMAMGEPLQQSFQGHWVDFNEDNLLDLHLIRDRLCFENRHYTQQPPGSDELFVQEAAAWNLDYAINCMSTSVTDYDRDNDLDLYLAAGLFEGNFLLDNEGEFFLPHVTLEGDSLDVHETSWAGTWFDADNNGWEDLHVCTGFSVYTNYPLVMSIYPSVPDHFFWNDGGVFELDQSDMMYSDGILSFTAVAADYNMDGFPDLINNIVGEYAQVLQGIPNGNRWIKLKLQGSESNRDGVGAKIRLHCADGMQYRMTFCGENYLCQGSRWEHFGLGTQTVIDSIVVTWPSGILDTYYEVESNQNLVLIEGETIEFDPCGNVQCLGCTYPSACNFEASAITDDGSCDFSCYLNPFSCGYGTIWDDEGQQCVEDPNACFTDLNYDGMTSVPDLLIFLGSFGTSCP